jgi:hypothetical protein
LACHRLSLYRDQIRQKPRRTNNTMQKAMLNARSVRASNSRLQRAFFTTTSPRSILDPSKDPSDVTEKQAKNPEGANPAAQQAKIVKDQGPGQTQEEGRSTQRAGGGPQDGNTHQSGLGQKKTGQKSGEEAVNPAVKKS